LNRGNQQQAIMPSIPGERHVALGSRYFQFRLLELLFLAAMIASVCLVIRTRDQMSIMFSAVFVGALIGALVAFKRSTFGIAGAALGGFAGSMLSVMFVVVGDHVELLLNPRPTPGPDFGLVDALIIVTAIYGGGGAFVGLLVGFLVRSSERFCVPFPAILLFL
jgi:hypothetical protein